MGNKNIVQCKYYGLNMIRKHSKNPSIEQDLVIRKLKDNN